jgi:hypothetical protein
MVEKVITRLKAAHRKGKEDAKEKREPRNPYRSHPGDLTIERGEWFMYNRGYNKNHCGILEEGEQMELFK